MAESSLGTLRVKIEADITSLKNGLNVAKAEFNQYSNDMLGAIQKNQAGLNTLGMALTGIGAVTVAGLGSAVKTFAGFEEQMKNVQSISNSTKAEFDELSAFALKLGKDTVYSSKQSAEALYFMASAGFSATEQMQATKAVLTLATATNYDLGRSSEFVATTLTSFGLKATDSTRVADVMALVIGKTQATMEKLGYSMPYVASTAHMLGMSIEETAAALGLLYSGGLRGEAAGERLRGALNDLLLPTPKATQAIKDLGLTIDQVNPSTHSLVEIVGAFQKTTFTASDAAKIFGDRAEGMSILVQQGADKLKNLTTELNNSAGAAQKMADIQKEALAKSFEQLAGSVENLKIKLGESLAPEVKRLTEYLEKMVDTLADMPKDMLKETTQLIALGGGLTALTGASILFLTQLPNLITGLKVVGTGLAAIGAGSVVAGITAVTASLLLLSAALTDIVEKPTTNKAKYLSQLETLFYSLQGAMEEAKSKGLDPYTMSLGELGKVSSLVSQTNLNEFAKALGATYGETSRVKDLLEDLKNKTGDLGKSYEPLTTSVKNTTGALTYGYEAGKKSEEGLRELTDALGLTEKATVTTGGIVKEFGKSAKDAGDGSNQLSGANKEAKLTLDDLSKGASQTQEALTNLFEKTTSGLGTYKEAWVANADGILVKTREFIANQKVVTETGIQEVAIATVKGLEGVKDAHIASGIEILEADMKAKGLLVTNTQMNTDAIKTIEWASTADQTQTAIEFGNHMLEIKQSNDAKALQLGMDAVKEQSAQEKAEKEDLAQWLEQNAEFVILANRNKYKSEYEDMLQFQAGELNSYKAQTQLINLEYNDRLAKAQLFGLNEIEIEKWKDEQILQLKMDHAMNYLNLVGNFSTDIANISLDLANTLGLYNEQEYADEQARVMAKYNLRIADAKQRFTDEKELAEALRDIEQWKNDEIDKIQSDQAEHRKEIENNALVRFAKWIDTQINLITDLKNAYLDLSSIIGAVGNLIDYLTGRSTSNVAKLGELLVNSGGTADATGNTLASWGAKLMGTAGTTGAGATTAETGGWLSSLGSGLKTGAGMVAGNLSALSLLGIFGYAAYKGITTTGWEEEDAYNKEIAEYNRGVKQQQDERANATAKAIASNVALGNLKSSYMTGGATTTPSYLTGSGLAGAGTYISSKRIFSADTGKQITGAVLPAYVPPAIQTATGISGGMDMSSTNSILSELSRYAGQIETVLWDNLPSIKGNTSKDIVINFAGLMSELNASNESLKTNLVNAIQGISLDSPDNKEQVTTLNEIIKLFNSANQTLDKTALSSESVKNGLDSNTNIIVTELKQIPDLLDAINTNIRQSSETLSSNIIKGNETTTKEVVASIDKGYLPANLPAGYYAGLSLIEKEMKMNGTLEASAKSLESIDKGVSKMSEGYTNSQMKYYAEETAYQIQGYLSDNPLKEYFVPSDVKQENEGILELAKGFGNTNNILDSIYKRLDFSKMEGYLSNIERNKRLDFSKMEGYLSNIERNTSAKSLESIDKGVSKMSEGYTDSQMKYYAEETAYQIQGYLSGNPLKEYFVPSDVKQENEGILELAKGFGNTNNILDSIYKRLDFSKMEGYLSNIERNTSTPSTFSTASMDSLADAIMRSYQRRGVL